MVKILVLYYSRTGHTRQMAEAVALGVKAAGGSADLKPVAECSPDLMLEYDGLVVGSPTYYGLAAGPIKDLFDRSIVHHGKLQGKVGGAFSSAGIIGGGSETAVISILQMMLVHGMIVQGQAKGNHYGVVCIGAPDEKALERCLDLGKRVTALTRRLLNGEG